MNKNMIYGIYGLICGFVIGGILAVNGHPPIGISGTILGAGTTGIGCIIGTIIDNKEK